MSDTTVTFGLFETLLSIFRWSHGLLCLPPSALICENSACELSHQEKGMKKLVYTHHKIKYITLLHFYALPILVPRLHLQNLAHSLSYQGHVVKLKSFLSVGSGYQCNKQDRTSQNKINKSGLRAGLRYGKAWTRYWVI